MVLVIQECFHDYMAREFNFAHMRSARQGDSFHIHSYALCEVNKEVLKLHLRNRISTDANGIALCLGLQAEAKLELEQIVKYVQSRISEKTLFTPI